MALFAELLAKLPKSKEKHMSAQGYALWICWNNNLDPVVMQTLQIYGGMFLKEEHNQSVWFFFNTDVFLALARLYVWAKFNKLSASAQLLSTRFHFGPKGEANIEIDAHLENQEIYPAENLEVWIHSKAQQHGTGIPGLTFKPSVARQGMASAAWFFLEADTRLPYSSSLGWYAILRPLGNPLDKNYQEKWPKMQQSIAEILKSNKFKFLVHEDFMIILVENLPMLRTWLRELLTLCEEVKTTNREEFWPHVSVAVDRKGLNFNTDLPKRVSLLWNKLSPDFPYMSYRTAYLLGDGFSIQDLRFSDNHKNLDTWCTISLDAANSNFNTIPVLMASKLLDSDEPCCFHCGINTHTSARCPTKKEKRYDSYLEGDNLGLDLKDVNTAFKEIEKNLSHDEVHGYEKTLAKTGTSKELLETIFDINFYAQARAMPYMWLNKTRDFSKDRESAELVRDESVAWEFYDKYIKADQADLTTLAKELKDNIVRNPRDMRLRTIYGFVAMNLGDYALATQSFKDAATLTAIPALQAWNEYLQARVAEIQGQYVNAISQYEQVQRVAPQWRDLEYRRFVCKVKMGFGEQALYSLSKLIQDIPTYFYRCLIDPELGRGQALILMHLFPQWKEAENIAKREIIAMQKLEERIKAWFPPPDPNYHVLSRYTDDLRKVAHIQNYMAFLQLKAKIPVCEKHIDDFIQKQTEELQERYKLYLANVQQVRDEASWFPFPKILRDFSDQFNDVATILNWAFTSNFHEPEVFQQAIAKTSEVEDLLRKLKQKLKLLRTVRDSTLFGVTFLKTFFWIELVCLILCFVGVPAIVMFGDEVGLGWLKNILASQQWEVQKVLLGIVTIISIGLATLRSTIIFERRRDKLIKEAKEQREKMQNERLERVRKKNKEKVDRIIKERKKEEELRIRRRLEDD